MAKDFIEIEVNCDGSPKFEELAKKIAWEFGHDWTDEAECGGCWQDVIPELKLLYEMGRRHGYSEGHLKGLGHDTLPIAQLELDAPWPLSSEQQVREAIRAAEEQREKGLS